MPKRLSLDLPEPVLAKLRELAARSGRSVDEIALDLIEAQLSDEPQS
jgi:plasmid stability protein